MTRELDFERQVLELERQIEELRKIAAARGLGGAADDDKKDDGVQGAQAQAQAQAQASKNELERQIARLEGRARMLQEQVFNSLSRWQIVQVSRHPHRPYTLDYIAKIFTGFTELHGDRSFGDDGAIVAGLARLDRAPVMVIGHQKGRTTKENMLRNFGMARPEGYRKAIRLMRMAERFNLPIISLIDTPGAYPGIDAEERGQAQAIAESLEAMASLEVPVISAVIGEGGSGGALAIGVANRVVMLEYATYSVISPEACSTILFKDPSHAEQAADALRLTASDLASLRVIDEVIEEPLGGAHRDPDTTAKRLHESLLRHLEQLRGLGPQELVNDRYQRFRRLGAFVRAGAAPE